MASFEVSAPGRIILSGEHSVMYKRACVATGLDLHTKLEFHELPNETQIKIDFPAVDLIGYTISLEEVRKIFSEPVITQIHPMNLFEYVKSFITINGKWTTLEQRLSLRIFFFLLYSIAIREEFEIKSFYVKVSTEIPIGAGLGSSTSFVVCLATCFLHWKRIQRGDDFSFELALFNYQILEDIKTYTKHCEKYVQDDACTTIDSNICVYGNTTVCRLDNYIRYSTESRNVMKMKILLIDSKIRQNKFELVEQLARLQHYSSMTFESLLDQLNNTAIQIYYKLRSINNATANLRSQHLYNLVEQHNNELKMCIIRNQQLLSESSLSNDAFDNICSIANTYGLAGKLTGFGGRFAYILLLPTTSISHILEAKRCLTNAGYTVKNTFINCEGVKIYNSN